MAIPHVSSVSNSRILYPHKDSQTKPVGRQLVSMEVTNMLLYRDQYYIR